MCHENFKRCALCVEIKGDWCKMLYADDLSSVEYRPTFKGATIGQWYRLSKNEEKIEIEPMPEEAEKPLRMTLTGRNCIKVLMPIYFEPDFSEFGCDFYSPLLERVGLLNCALELESNGIQPGIEHMALLTLKFDGSDGLPCWYLDSAQDVLLDNEDEEENGNFTPPIGRKYGIEDRLNGSVGKENIPNAQNKTQLETKQETRQEQLVVRTRQNVSDTDSDIDEEPIELEQEAVVLFTQIIGLELHMRFFEERAAKFTSYRCCNRSDLPSHCAFRPPAPGTWARISFKLSQNNVRHIQITRLQTDESDFGAIIRNAREIVRPENERIWATFLSCGRSCSQTVQQLVEDSKESDEEEKETKSEMEDEEDEDDGVEPMNEVELRPTAPTSRHPTPIAPTSTPSRLLCLTSRQRYSTLQMFGIVVDCCSATSSPSSVYHVWPFCTNRPNPRLLTLWTSEVLPHGHWLKFDLKDYTSGTINVEKGYGMEPWLNTQSKLLGGKQIVCLNNCYIIIPTDPGSSEVCTYNWKPGDSKVPFIRKLVPKSEKIEKFVEANRGKRCVAKLMFEANRDHEGVLRGRWLITELQ